MTFRAEDYHPDWVSIARQIRDQANNACEFCGVANGAYGARDRFGEWRDELSIHCLNANTGEYLFPDGFPAMVKIILTTAHLCWETCGDKKCIDPTHLRALCQRCHLNYDRRHHLDVQRQNREAKRLRLQPLLVGMASETGGKR